LQVEVAVILVLGVISRPFFVRRVSPCGERRELWPD
jgi:hypothetical protein